MSQGKVMSPGNFNFYNHVRLCSETNCRHTITRVVKSKQPPVNCDSVR